MIAAEPILWGVFVRIELSMDAPLIKGASL